VSGLHRFAGGLGDGVLDVGTLNLGHGVAVLHIDGDDDDGRVVDAVLSGDGPAGVLHGGDGGVGHGVSNGSNMGNGGKTVSAISTKVLRICLGVSFPLDDGDGKGGGVAGGSVTDGVLDVLARLLVLNFLGLDGLGGADVLGLGHAGSGDEDLVLDLAVGEGGGYVVRQSAGQVGWVSLSLSGGGGGRGSGQEKDSKKLAKNIIHELIVYRFYICKMEWRVKTSGMEEGKGGG